MSSNPFPSPLAAVQRVALFNPANTNTIWQSNLNPTVLKRTAGNVRKYVKTTNSTSIVQGSSEYPPTELKISWSQLDYAQVTQLIAFTQVSPCVFVDNRDNGFLGELVINSIEQLLVVRDAWSVDASFLVLSPFGGLVNDITKLTAPTITATLSAKTGYLSNPADVYLWMTVSTPWGQSTVGSVTHVHNTTGSAAYDLSFTPPSSSSYRKCTIYWYSANTPTSATILYEILSGFPQDVGNTATLWQNYVPYNTVSPPLYSTSFSGSWQGSLWIPSS